MYVSFMKYYFLTPGLINVCQSIYWVHSANLSWRYKERRSEWGKIRIRKLSILKSYLYIPLLNFSSIFLLSIIIYIYINIYLTFYLFFSLLPSHHGERKKCCCSHLMVMGKGVFAANNLSKFSLNSFYYIRL